MCQFKSGIVFRSGEVFTNPFTDHHEDLIALRGLKDDRESRVQNWVRVEYRPDEKWETFTLHLDENETPAWWDDEMKFKVVAWFEKLIENMTVTGDHKLILGGQYIFRDANVDKLGAGAHIQAMLGKSQVGVMRETAQVGEMWGTAKVGVMWGTAKVGMMRETAQVGEMWETAQVGEMWETAQAPCKPTTDCRDKAAKK